jgi:phosphoglycerate dehydrogenase-like enzyme
MHRTAENPPVRVLIATPLEADQVERIKAFAPGRVDVLFEPELLPVPRYIADHHGVKRQLDEAGRSHWRELLRQADISFDFDWSDPARLPQTAPALRWVQGTSAGIGEFLQSTGLAGSHIRFTTASGVHAKPLAEFVMLGLLYFVREVPALLQRKIERRWQRFTSGSLDGMRLLIVGLGSVGRAVAGACAPFGIEVWGMGRTAPKGAIDGLQRYVEPDNLHQALGEVDALVLACPLTDLTRNLIGRQEIAMMRHGAIIINVARGAVVDDHARLVDADLLPRELEHVVHVADLVDQLELERLLRRVDAAVGDRPRGVERQLARLDQTGQELPVQPVDHALEDLPLFVGEGAERAPHVLPLAGLEGRGRDAECEGERL